MISIRTTEKVPRLMVLFDCFIIYSILGWGYETIYCYINLGRYIKRGFLYGPICPIYGGCIMIAVLLFSDRIRNKMALFFACALLASCVEYIVSSVMEFIFGRRWWNYSDQLFNINGRVCLGAAIVFGLCGILIIRYFHPKLVCFINENAHLDILKKVTRVALTIFILDLFVTVKMNL
jgi:uncharacterized membrane protein